MYRNIINIVLGLLLILSIYFNVNYSILIVNGPSMQPTYNNHDIIMYNKNVSNLEKYDIVMFKYNNHNYIKRVHGLPGDTIAYNNGNIYINGVGYTDLRCETCSNKTFKLKKEQYYVLGDNTYISKDSRIMGNIYHKLIYGIIPYKK